MFTVTHYGLSKDFDSIYKAMRYLKSVRMIDAVLWSTERPLTDTSRFIKPSEVIW